MPDSPPFPFLNLPTLVQLLIVNCLNLPDFLLFSLISRKAKGIAKRVKFDLDSVHWDLNEEIKIYQLQLRVGSFYLSICNAKNEAKTIISHPTILLNADKTPISIDRRYEFCEFWKINEENIDNDDFLKLLEHLSKHCLSVLNVTNFNFRPFNLKDPENFWGFQLVEKWEEVYISGCNPFFVKGDTLKFCLKTLKTRRLHLHCRVEEEFKWTPDCGVLKVEDLIINDSKWITLDALLSMECKKLRMTSPADQVSDSDLNTFIKHWLSGELRNLVQLYVTMERDYTEERLDDILEGIETFQWEQRPDFQGYDFSGGRDIRRSDEVFATAALLYRRTFIFTVWPSQNVTCS